MMGSCDLGVIKDSFYMLLGKPEDIESEGRDGMQGT